MTTTGDHDRRRRHVGEHAGRATAATAANTLTSTPRRTVDGCVAGAGAGARRRGGAGGRSSSWWWVLPTGGRRRASPVLRHDRGRTAVKLGRRSRPTLPAHDQPRSAQPVPPRRQGGRRHRRLVGSRRPLRPRPARRRRPGRAGGAAGRPPGGAGRRARRGARRPRRPLRRRRPRSAWSPTTVDTLGRLDVLVNNAGIGGKVGIEDEELDSFRATMELNVTALWHLCKLARDGADRRRRRQHRQRRLDARPRRRRRRSSRPATAPARAPSST